MHPTTIRPASDRSLLAAPRRRARTLARLASDAGQGTVEYVGLLLLMASVLAAIVAVSGELDGTNQVGKKVVTQVGKSIDRVGAAEPKK